MDTRLIIRDYVGSIKTDGGTHRVKRDPEWQIRRVVCQEKPLRRIKVPVPQTDTGGRDEYSKALG